MLQRILTLTLFFLILTDGDQSLDAWHHDRARVGHWHYRRQCSHDVQSSLCNRRTQIGKIRGAQRRCDAAADRSDGSCMEDALEDRRTMLWLLVIKLRNGVLAVGETVTSHEDGCSWSDED